MKKTIKIVLLIAIILITFSQNCFAATDQFRAFMTMDYENSSLQISNANTSAANAVLTFQKLGYINAQGENRFYKTPYKSVVINEWISLTGNNYGFYVHAHGNPNLFTMTTGDSSQYIYPSDITGWWHLVFLDSCSCLSTDAFASAFKTVGYSNRATLGWYNDVEFVASAEWWGYFYPEAGTTNLRSACLAAADQCENSTPIRIYGDKTWYGWAW